MNWFKISAIAAGVLTAFLVISSVIGFLAEAALVALVVGAVLFGVRAALRSRQVTQREPAREVRPPRYGDPRRSWQKPDVEDELTRLRREMRDMQ